MFVNKICVSAYCVFRHTRGRMFSQSAKATASSYQFETLQVTSPVPWVFHVEFNRPEQLNAMNTAFWREIGECFNTLANDEDCRAIVMSAKGKHFTAGLDLSDMGELVGTVMGDQDIARKSKAIYRKLKHFQDSFSALEKCPKPIIGAIHSACIGAGVDIITATDIRYCTQDAYFQVKEVDLGLAADVGTLQRLPKVIGSDSLTRELAFTARKMHSSEALSAGLVSRIFSDKERMIKASVELAAVISSKSPVAVQGTKIHLNYSRDHTTEEGLEHIALWNMTMLQSEDLLKSAAALMDRKAPPPVFAKL